MKDNWIDQALTDLIIFKYEHRFWISQEQVWRKWIRTSERGIK